MTITCTSLGNTNRLWHHLLLVSLFVFVVTGCHKNDPGDGGTDPGQQLPDPLQHTADVTTTVRGLVVDEAGKPISGVTVFVEGNQAATSDVGAFELEDINVPGNRCVIVCEKDGYFKGIRAEVPLKDGTTETHIVLMNSGPTHTINAASGGKATLQNGSEVELPANGLVDGSGAAYNGTVNVTLRYLDPTAAGFGTVVPGGDMLAQRADQSTSILYSYGILRVQLTSLGGEKLQLAADKTATLVMDIPEKQVATAPATIPLWYFDEDKGVWKEEGSATKQGDKYVGTVKHFTDWNCDSDEDVATIVGKLVDCNGDPAWGHIEFGQVGGEVGSSTDTENDDGRFSRRVPAGVELSVVVYDPLYIQPLIPGNQGTGKLIVVVPPLAEGQVYDVGTLQIFPCMTSLSANFNLKSGDQLQSIVFESGNGLYRYLDNPSVDFTLKGLPPKTSISMTVITTMGISLTKTFQSPEAGENVDLGTIDLSDFQEAYITGKLVCKDAAINDGQISAAWTSGTNTGIEYTAPEQNGVFQVTVPLNASVELAISTSKGSITKMVTTTATAGSFVDIGTIDFCGGPQPGENSFVITGDGFNNTVQSLELKPYPSSASIYITSDNVTSINAVDVSDSLLFSLTFTGKAIGKAPADANQLVIIQYKTGNKTVNYLAGNDITGSQVTIMVTRYDAVGNLVEGTFEGTFVTDTNSTVTIKNGKFSVVRYPDL